MNHHFNEKINTCYINLYLHKKISFFMEFFFLKIDYEIILCERKIKSNNKEFLDFVSIV